MPVLGCFLGIYLHKDYSQALAYQSHIYIWMDLQLTHPPPPDCVYALCILLKLFEKCFLLRLLLMESVVDHAQDFSHLRIGELPPQNGDHTELLLSASTQVSLSYLKLITKLANNRVME